MRHLHETSETHTLCGLGKSQAESKHVTSAHVTKARKDDCKKCRRIFRARVRDLRESAEQARAEGQVLYLSLYRNGHALPNGFMATRGKDESLTRIALLDAALQSVGVEGIFEAEILPSGGNGNYESLDRDKSNA